MVAKASGGHTRLAWSRDPQGSNFPTFPIEVMEAAHEMDRSIEGAWTAAKTVEKVLIIV